MSTTTEMVLQKIKALRSDALVLSSSSTSAVVQLSASSVPGVAKAYAAAAEAIREAFLSDDPPVFVYTQATRGRIGNSFTMTFKLTWRFNKAKAQETRDQKVRRL